MRLKEVNDGQRWSMSVRAKNGVPVQQNWSIPESSDFIIFIVSVVGASREFSGFKALSLMW